SRRRRRSGSSKTPTKARNGSPPTPATTRPRSAGSSRSDLTPAWGAMENTYSLVPEPAPRRSLQVVAIVIFVMMALPIVYAAIIALGLAVGSRDIHEWIAGWIPLADALGGYLPALDAAHYPPRIPDIGRGLQHVLLI